MTFRFQVISVPIVSKLFLQAIETSSIFFSGSKILGHTRKGFMMLIFGAEFSALRMLTNREYFFRQKKLFVKPYENLIYITSMNCMKKMVTHRQCQLKNCTSFYQPFIQRFSQGLPKSFCNKNSFYALMGLLYKNGFIYMSKPYIVYIKNQPFFSLKLLL